MKDPFYEYGFQGEPIELNYPKHSRLNTINRLAYGCIVAPSLNGDDLY